MRVIEGGRTCEVTADLVVEPDFAEQLEAPGGDA
jgi:hypothetical protein